jgi:hypothetical protein
MHPEFRTIEWSLYFNPCWLGGGSSRNLQIWVLFEKWKLLQELQ